MTDTYLRKVHRPEVLRTDAGEQLGAVRPLGGLAVSGGRRPHSQNVWERYLHAWCDLGEDLSQLICVCEIDL